MKKSIAIVTGATGGFGKEFVRLFSREDVEIWAIARSRERLDALAKEFNVRTFSMDLSDRKSFSILNTALKNEDAVVKYLINNAGFAKFCAYDDITVEESLNIIDVNVSAVTAVGLTCLPYMERGSRIINVSSQSSFFPLPYLNLYSATKVFIRHYTRALNIELKDRGITATAVCPGWMKTNLLSRGEIGARKSVTNFAFMTTPDKVAAKALMDAKKDKPLSIYGAYVKMTHVLGKILPQKIMMKVWLAQQGLK